MVFCATLIETTEFPVLKVLTKSLTAISWGIIIVRKKLVALHLSRGSTFCFNVGYSQHVQIMK